MVLLTGASGFIGKYLYNSLQEQIGINEIIACTSKPIVNGKFLLHNNYNFSENYFKDNGFQNFSTIIHAGAFTPKSGAEANNVEACNRNISNTFSLIKSLPNLPKQFIFLSTLDVYANTKFIINEQTEIKPSTMYGWSKYYCERMLEIWAQQNGVDLKILRVGHVYGPGEDQYQKIIPNTIKRLHNNLQPQVWGKGDDLRSFIFIDDVVNFIIQSVLLPDVHQPINLVSEHASSIIEIIELLIKISNKETNIEFIKSNLERRDFIFDNSYMKSILGKEKTTLSEGLKKEWDYFIKLNNN
jgi:nucleoside-diphosphate-sugar epimerase